MDSIIGLKLQGGVLRGILMNTLDSESDISAKKHSSIRVARASPPGGGQTHRQSLMSIIKPYCQVIYQLYCESPRPECF